MAENNKGFPNWEALKSELLKLRENHISIEFNEHTKYVWVMSGNNHVSAYFRFGDRDLKVSESKDNYAYFSMSVNFAKMPEERREIVLKTIARTMIQLVEN